MKLETDVAKINLKGSPTIIQPSARKKNGYAVLLFHIFFLAGKFCNRLAMGYNIPTVHIYTHISGQRKKGEKTVSQRSTDLFVAICFF